ncbi:MAG: hypothetical protein PHS36_05415 [Candidatus Cloacimonetes bacterium]|nr:hypothetical protein [Candidatus Cloacimonadota bacterium]
MDFWWISGILRKFRIICLQLPYPINLFALPDNYSTVKTALRTSTEGARHPGKSVYMPNPD